MVTHILASRKYDFGKLTKIDVVTVWLLAKKVETIGLVSSSLILLIEKEIIWVPFCGLITKILKHIGFNLEDEKS